MPVEAVQVAFFPEVTEIAFREVGKQLFLTPEPAGLDF